MQKAGHEDKIIWTLAKIAKKKKAAANLLWFEYLN
jgi:hypothetical protein